jgi:uncharacterized protein (TIGR02001 family)
MKKWLLTLVLIALCTSLESYAEEETTVVAEENPPSSPLSGNAAITSNYVFRGVSQTKNLGALQGSLTYEFPIGLYFNLWGSNVQFEESNANTEIDTVVGWRGDVFKEMFHYDISAQRYNYIGQSDYSYNELLGLFSYSIFVLNLGYSQDEYATHKTGTYINIGINYEIPAAYLFKIEGVSILATAGHSSLPREADNSYNDYLVGLTKAFNDTISASVTWTTTNGRQHDSPYDSTHIFATVMASF